MKMHPDRRPQQIDIALATTLRRGAGAPSGALEIGGAPVNYTALRAEAPATAGSGTSPLHLFAGSLGACYALAFAQCLDGARLAWSSLDILTSVPLVPGLGLPSIDSVTIQATVRGADATARSAYHRAATEARDRCPIARSIRGNVAYKLAEVIVTERPEER